MLVCGSPPPDAGIRERQLSGIESAESDCLPAVLTWGRAMPPSLSVPKQWAISSAQRGLHRQSGCSASAEAGASDHCRDHWAAASSRPNAALAAAAVRIAGRHDGRTFSAAIACCRGSRASRRTGHPH